jgi:predicted nuclease with TOPRIM domain
MAEEPENLMLVFLRRIDGNVARLRDDMQDVKFRLTALEQEAAWIRGAMASIQGRLDRLELRVERIERRLDLIEPAHGA